MKPCEYCGGEPVAVLRVWYPGPGTVERLICGACVRQWMRLRERCGAWVRGTAIELFALDWREPG